MLKITSYGPVIRFDLARTIFGRGRYWTTAYWVDFVWIKVSINISNDHIAGKPNPPAGPWL